MLRSAATGEVANRGPSDRDSRIGDCKRELPLALGMVFACLNCVDLSLTGVTDRQRNARFRLGTRSAQREPTLRFRSMTLFNYWRRTMSLDSLHDLFVDELKDVLSAEKQLTKALPKMAKAATSPQLRKSFEK